MRTLALATALLLTLAACGDQTDAATGGDLDGLTFVGADVAGHPLVKGSQLRLRFKDGHVGVNAGCNSIDGTAKVDKGVLVVKGSTTTDMGCDKPLMDQDTWIVSFLESSPTLTRGDHTLTLAKDAVTLTLTEEEYLKSQQPPVPLQGTTWKLDTVINGAGDDGTASSVPQDAVATIRIVEGRIEVATGCNTGGGKVKLGAGTLTVEALALTKMGCPDALRAQESAFVAVLQGQTGYEQDHDVLTLTSEDGATSLRFVR
jgi:heat shock protein HslJ